MHGLRELNLDQCAAITDAGMGQSFEMHQPDLLSLAGCANITDAAIETLGFAWTVEREYIVITRSRQRT